MCVCVCVCSFLFRILIFQSLFEGSTSASAPCDVFLSPCSHFSPSNNQLVRSIYLCCFFHFDSWYTWLVTATTNDRTIERSQDRKIERTMWKPSRKTPKRSIKITSINSMSYYYVYWERASIFFIKKKIVPMAGNCLYNRGQSTSTENHNSVCHFSVPSLLMLRYFPHLILPTFTFTVTWWFFVDRFTYFAIVALK